MRGLAPTLLVLSACTSPSPLWLPLPAEEAVLYFLRLSDPARPEILGRTSPGVEDLRLSLPANPEELVVLAFELEALQAATARLDTARWAELQLLAEPETCARRRVQASSQRQAVALTTRSFTVDLEQQGWRAAPIEPTLAAALALTLPLDPGACGGPPPTLRPLARLEDGFTARGRTHVWGQFMEGTDPFQLEQLLGRPDGAVVALSKPYLYHLRPGRELQTAEPGELLTPEDVVGLPAGAWSFAGLQALPGPADRVLVALARPGVAQPQGALVEVTTSSVGFEGARLLHTLGVRPSDLAVTREGSYLYSGSGSSVGYGRDLTAPPEWSEVPGGGSLIRARATGDPDYPFVLTNTGGVLILLDPWRGEQRVVSEGALNAASRDLAVSSEPALRVEQLRYDGQVFTWVAPGPGTSARVPMPAELGACAAPGDVCEPHYLSFGASSLARAPGRGLVFAPNTCGRVFSWSPEDDCVLAWRTEPDIGAPERFRRFQALVLDGDRLLGSGLDGSVHAAALE